MTEIEIQESKKKAQELQLVKCGSCFEDYLQSKKATPQKRGLSDNGASNLRSSTIDILNHCNPHDASTNQETTHLVVGYVQSGKTMSFTGVLAMARDNHYRVAIVLTGITTILKDQTAERLQDDLDLDSSVDNFVFYTNPAESDFDEIVQGLRLSDKPLVIIPILKHRKYIDNVTSIFSRQTVKKALGNETVIIIDDEADQASLNGFGLKNSKKTNQEELDKQSATYAAILRLRAQLPGNSYIQYTATPQANLLITTADILSPKSHTVLEPGEDYVGGKRFFGMMPDGSLYNGNLVVKIPEEEVYHKKKKALSSMPQSLREALMMHVWAVVLVIKWFKRPGIKQLSMMIHPTDIIEGNKVFEGWVRKEISQWSEAFDKPEFHENRVILMNRFRKLYVKATQFYAPGTCPSFEEIADKIPDVVNNCRIYRITGESDDDSNNIKWEAHKMNILIGAQMLNRGFTVKNLATTYMPRYTTPVANADTIEQRCRFFGYKMDYIESCRVYLPDWSIKDYKDYVRHEEELRAKLKECSTLKEYEHCVMMTPRLRPTRMNVLPKQMVKSKLVEWTRYDHFSGVKMLSENKTVGETFVANHIAKAADFQLQAYSSAKYADGEIKKHSLVSMDLKDFIPLLTDFTAGNFEDTMVKSMTLRYLRYLDSVSPLTIKVIFMSRNQVRERSKYDSKDGTWTVQLSQGRSNIGEHDDYCGDNNLFDPDFITVQLHHITLTGLSVADAPFRETYALAIHFPDSLQAVYDTSVAQKYNMTD